MSPDFQAVTPLVHAAEIRPAMRRFVALAISHVYDANAGHIAASMAQLAAMVSMSKAQVRRHVHALVTLGVLEVTANAHGGAPRALPHYRFNLLRLRALAQQTGRTSDLFHAAPAPRTSFFGEDVEDVRQQMTLELRGKPGNRTIHFSLDSPKGDIPYGWTPLRILLLPPNVAGSWNGWLNPETGAPSWALPIFTFPETVERLRQWAQSVALGRIESIETA